MLAIYLLFLTLSAVFAREFSIDEPGNPIHFVRTSYGVFDHERVEYLEAIILPYHVKNQGSINFTASGCLNDYYHISRAPGDETGHLVGPQFSGPAEWYNLSPQNARVNRNIGYQSLTTEWYNTECEVREFLEEGGAVLWGVTMAYVANSNRPDSYHLQVEFYKGGNIVKDIDTTIRNPFESDDSTVWICNYCRSNNQDELGDREEQCVQALET